MDFGAGLTVERESVTGNRALHCRNQKHRPRRALQVIQEYFPIPGVTIERFLLYS
jgi:hypothetical protein